ncbi:MAG: ROK family protein [Clostridia bacterium]|nr:ROK family protein [Clostridia bacterium]
MSYIVGFDVGGTKCAVTLAETVTEGTPKILCKKKFDTEADKPYDVLARFMTELDTVLSEFSLSYSKIPGIGISCGGPLNSEKGIIMSPPNLPRWDNIEICKYFYERTGIDCHLQNDANACAVAEWKYGAGKGLNSIVFLTFGTGLGAGLILDGRLYRGKNDNAGEIGHVRLEQNGPIGYGKPGSCEGFCSGGGISQMGVSALSKCTPSSRLYEACAGEPNKITAKLIADLAHQGDEMCREIYRTCAKKLGMTLSILCDVLDPDAIIIGGIFMRSDDLLIDGIAKVMREEALIPCPVLKAGLGENVGDYAALSIAEDNY